MTFTYTPHGVCSRQIVIDIDENTTLLIQSALQAAATVICKA